MTSNADFWNDRVKKVGHTGWANAIVYAYDQPARLAAIDHVIREHSTRQGLAVDFGTGSGDFAVTLAKFFDRIVATDISSEVINVAKRNHGANGNVDFRVCGSVEEIALSQASVDLVLSITVLGHLMSNENLAHTLSAFRRALHPDGLFVALEYTPQIARKAGPYQRFLPADEWAAHFQEQGYNLVDSYGIYHPTEKPSDGYRRYSQSLTTRIANKLGNSALIKMCTRKARSIQSKNPQDWWPVEDDDTMRIMIFRPTESEQRGA